jgi:hypothetical protein
MFWIPELFPCRLLTLLSPSPLLRGGREGETRLSSLLASFSLKKGGEEAVGFVAGLEQAVGLGWDGDWKKRSQEECAIAYSKPVGSLYRLTFVSSFTVDSPDTASHQEEVPCSYSLLITKTEPS